MLNITNTNFRLISNNFTNEAMREIAYSMDLLIPGFYLWLPGIDIRFGGAVPDDQPYRYPGKIHCNLGVALVLPGYKIFSTYNGSYDPQ
jgi:hypothetical protein